MLSAVDSRIAYHIIGEIMLSPIDSRIADNIIV